MMKNYITAIIALLALSSHAQNSPTVGAGIEGSYAICQPGTCITLAANLLNAKETTNYTVASLPYNNLYPLTGGTVLNVTEDDVWSPIFTLPFSFCFYGTTYTSLSVGSNGVITFNPTAPDQLCEWSFNTPVPSTTFPINNAIYGVYQDTDLRPEYIQNPAIQNVNYYVGGTTPNRYFVANFNELPLFACENTALQTSQIVLYESSNIIDVYVKNRTACTWNQGSGLIGIQNQEGTLATFPQYRNTGNWNAINEAWRFKPNGASVTPAAYTWFADNAIVGTEPTLTVCPTATAMYSVAIQYMRCDGNLATTSAPTTVIVEAPANIQNPVDLHMCSSEDTAVFNIDVTAVMLNGVDPNNFDVSYYTTLADAENWATGNISDLSNFTAVDGQVIYVRVTNVVTGNDCFEIKSFILHVDAPPAPPTGSQEQTFTAGETLADLELEGTNIQWYAEAEGGEPLPMSTLLVTGTTYYATQTTASGCESTPNFRVAQDRFPVTVTDIALGNPNYTISNLKVTPNPAKDILNIAADQSINAIEVYTLLGQRIGNYPINATSTQINLSLYASGTYLLKISASYGTKTVKIVKQ